MGCGVKPGRRPVRRGRSSVSADPSATFSSVVRDNWDLVVSLMDGQGRQFASLMRGCDVFTLQPVN
jgi:hypothetical protein